MTPKEKAKQMIDNYMKCVYIDKSMGAYFNAKHCALIAIDEMLKLCSHTKVCINYNKDIELLYSYYEEVKQEIEKF